MQNQQTSRDGAPTPSLLGLIISKMQVNPRACGKTQSQPPHVCSSPGHTGIRTPVWTLCRRGGHQRIVPWCNKGVSRQN